jgi:hypothetical protein
MKQKRASRSTGTPFLRLELFRFAERPQFAGQKLLGKRRQFVVRNLPLLVELHFRFGCFSSTPLALLRHVTLVV